MENIFRAPEFAIKASPHPEVDEVAFSTDTKRWYKYNGTEWIDITDDQGASIHMDLYDMNKQIIAQLPPLTEEQITERITDIFNLHETFHNHYYMLYGKSISYFTLFQIENMNYFPGDVLDCLKNIGEIKAIDPTEDGGAVEIWIGMSDGEAACLYLFPYDSGLVVVGEGSRV